VILSYRFYILIRPGKLVFNLRHKTMKTFLTIWWRITFLNLLSILQILKWWCIYWSLGIQFLVFFGMLSSPLILMGVASSFSFLFSKINLILAHLWKTFSRINFWKRFIFIQINSGNTRRKFQILWLILISLCWVLTYSTIRKTRTN